MEYLRYEKRGQIGLLTIARPRELNALNSSVLAELAALVDELGASPIRCLVITGAGAKAFVAGADIAEMAEMTPAAAREFSLLGNSVTAKIADLPMPTIAAVNGYALGGGCELALSCDIRIAAENAAFALPEVGLGLIPGYGGLQRLARLVGPGPAMEIALSARRVKAAEALPLGLVNAVHPAEELLSRCFELAERIAAQAPLAVRRAKSVLKQSLGLTAAEAYCLEVEPFAACFATEDQGAAMRAFIEKRPAPPFQGK